AIAVVGEGDARRQRGGAVAQRGERVAERGDDEGACGADGKGGVVDACDRGRLVHGEREALGGIAVDAVVRGDREGVRPPRVADGRAGQSRSAVAVVGKAKSRGQNEGAVTQRRRREAGGHDGERSKLPHGEGNVVRARDRGGLFDRQREVLRIAAGAVVR